MCGRRAVPATSLFIILRPTMSSGSLLARPLVRALPMIHVLLAHLYLHEAAVAAAEANNLTTSWLVRPEGGAGGGKLIYEGYLNEGDADGLGGPGLHAGAVDGRRNEHDAGGGRYNSVPDFSHAGYRGGGVPIPFMPAAVELSPDATCGSSAGPGPPNVPDPDFDCDDRRRIQRAINAVSRRPVGPDGFRGAVLLRAGTYHVNGTLRIPASGIVLRGDGQGKDGGTRIRSTSTRSLGSSLVVIRDWKLRVNGSDDPVRARKKTQVRIMDEFVPVGTRTVRVANATGFAVGDPILVVMKVNGHWLRDMSRMDRLGWTRKEFRLKYRRVVSSIGNDNLVGLNAPIVQAIEARYGGGFIAKYVLDGEIENVGLEGLRLESSFESDEDEDHAWKAIRAVRLKNGWVRQVTGLYFAYGLTSFEGGCSQITVEDCAMLDHKSRIEGGRRYSFKVAESDTVLVHRCFTRDGRHDFASGKRAMGPNAFVDSLATNPHSDIGPHGYFSTGHLYDNIKGGAINVQNRKHAGSAHGWAGAQIMFWNCDARDGFFHTSGEYRQGFICDAPNSAMNWAVGVVGRKNEGHFTLEEPYGIWDAHNHHVLPRSLYYKQMAERLGQNSLHHVILPNQKLGDIWSDLSDWQGDGLFLDPVVAFFDEELIPMPGFPLSVGCRVRKLAMLDRGISCVWVKISGPGNATFANTTVLETSVVFDSPGHYEIQVEINDRVNTESALVGIEVSE